jgi:hypothetical protein
MRHLLEHHPVEDYCLDLLLVMLASILTLQTAAFTYSRSLLLQPQPTLVTTALSLGTSSRQPISSSITCRRANGSCSECCQLISVSVLSRIPAIALTSHRRSKPNIRNTAIPCNAVSLHGINSSLTITEPEWGLTLIHRERFRAIWPVYHRPFSKPARTNNVTHLSTQPALGRIASGSNWTFAYTHD